MQAMEQCQRKLAEWRRRNWWYTSELSKHSFLKKCIHNLQTDEDYHWFSGHQSEILKLPMLYPCECQTWVSDWFVRRMDWLGVSWLVDWLIGSHGCFIWSSWPDEVSTYLRCYINYFCFMYLWLYWIKRSAGIPMSSCVVDFFYISCNWITFLLCIFLYILTKFC